MRPKAKAPVPFLARQREGIRYRLAAKEMFCGVSQGVAKLPGARAQKPARHRQPNPRHASLLDDGHRRASEPQGHSATRALQRTQKVNPPTFLLIRGCFPRPWLCFRPSEPLGL